MGWLIWGTNPENPGDADLRVAGVGQGYEDAGTKGRGDAGVQGRGDAEMKE